MLSRYCALVTGLLFFAGEFVDGQDAQDRTQSFLDNHKSADVVNPDRAITDKARPSTSSVQESTLPQLSGVSEGKSTKVNTKELNKLRNEREAFVKERVKERTKKAEKSVAGARAAMLDQDVMIKQAKKEWEDTEAGRKLRRIERGAGTSSTLPELTY